MNTPVTVGQPGSSSGSRAARRAVRHLHRRLARSPALRVVGRRLLIAIPVLWGVTFLTFAVLNALPGDAASALLGANATPQEVQALSIKLHLNEPFLVRYGHWLGGVLHGDLGTSLYYNQSVSSILAQRLPVTIELVVYALVITFVVSVPLAVLSARRPRGVTDRASMALQHGQPVHRAVRAGPAAHPGLRREPAMVSRARAGDGRGHQGPDPAGDHPRHPADRLLHQVPARRPARADAVRGLHRDRPGQGPQPLAGTDPARAAEFRLSG